MEMSHVLVWATIIVYNRRGGLNNKNLFLIVVEAEKSKFRIQVWWGTDEYSFPGLQIAKLLTGSSQRQN